MDMLLKLESDLEDNNYITIAGIRCSDMLVDGEPINIASNGKDCFHAFFDRDDIDDIIIQGVGCFVNDMTHDIACNILQERKCLPWIIVVPEIGVMRGLFSLILIDYMGETNGILTYNIAIGSVSKIKF